ncbi:MAG TPA: alpha-L-fucosidase [Anaerohalosphaeraceae bacterium]|nr:alpha-L-fucosidase [Anaerohalosphaeraceae bacterium]
MSNQKYLFGHYCLALFIFFAASEIGLTASQVDPAALKHWQDLRFGMFIHWGPVSLTGQEIGWARGKQVPIEEYDQLYKQFNPAQFNADEWVSAAKDAGAKYIVLTTKHHDGFCLWDTKQTDFNIMNSPLKRDVVKELAMACKRQGIEFGTYYSTCDWHHPDFPLTSPGGEVQRETHNLDRYTDYLKAQVKELLVEYGPLLTLWFDVPQKFDAVRGQGVIDFVRSIQPTIVINNRTGAPGDYNTPEQHIGGFNRERSWETCMTICRQWAWKPDDAMKSKKECIQTLLHTIGGDGNLLFNVGPMPDGRIEPRQIERLREMGLWVKTYSDAIYGTRGGPFKPGKWGAATCKENKIFLFVMNWPEKEGLKIPALPDKVTNAVVRTGGNLTFTQTNEYIELDVPRESRDPIATVIELTVDGQAYAIQPLSMTPPSNSVAFGKKAQASNVFRKDRSYAPDKVLDDDPETRWATDENIFTAWIQIDLGSTKTVSSAMIDEREWNRIKRFELQYQTGTEWKTAYAGTVLGAEKKITFDPVQAQVFRLNILESEGGPTIWEVQLFQTGHNQNKES